MARKVFFSFYYKDDVWRANEVRKSWGAKDNNEAAGFVEEADFEAVEKEGDAAIKRWIDNQLEGTTVTVVLIGADTSTRPDVKYELEKSFARGNGMVGIHIHQLKNKDGNPSTRGSNKFGKIGKDEKGNGVYFSVKYPCYDWVDDDGYNNIERWIETAAQNAGR